MPDNEDTLKALDAELVALSALRTGVWGFLLPGTVGLLLWVYVCGGPLEIELASKPSRPGIVMLLLLPLLALGLGLGLRRPLVAMAAFPLALLPCLAVLEPLDLASLNTLWGAGLLAAGVTLYLLLTARMAPRRARLIEMTGQPLHGGIDPRFWRGVRHTLPRMLLLIAVLVVPLSALYSDAGQEKLVENFGSKRLDATLLIHTAHLFIFAMVGYLFFLSPSINQTIELFELRRSLRRELTEERQQTRRRWLAVVGIGALIAVVLSSLVNL